GLLPGYHTIGIAAPILLTIIRLVQGFALGGEFSGCIAYIVECSPAKYRGLAGSTSFMSMCIGMLFGLATAKLFRDHMPMQVLYEWGWRLPFIGGLFIGMVGLYIRRHVSESPLYKAAKESGGLSKTPLREVLSKHFVSVAVAVAIYMTVTAPFYTS